MENEKVSIFDESSRNNIFVKKISLERLSELERRYHRQIEACESFHELRWRKAFSAIRENGGKAHCKPTHKFQSDKKYWLYACGQIGIGFEWVDKPKEFINFELGQKFYELDTYSNSVYTRRRTFSIALEKAIEMVIDRETGSRYGFSEETAGKQLCLNINGRNYWYYLKQGRNIQKWEKLSWPDNQCKHITIY